MISWANPTTTWEQWLRWERKRKRGVEKTEEESLTFPLTFLRGEWKKKNPRIRRKLSESKNKCYFYQFWTSCYLWGREVNLMQPLLSYHVLLFHFFFSSLVTCNVHLTHLVIRGRFLTFTLRYKWLTIVNFAWVSEWVSTWLQT